MAELSAQNLTSHGRAASHTWEDPQQGGPTQREQPHLGKDSHRGRIYILGDHTWGRAPHPRRTQHWEDSKKGGP